MSQPYNTGPCELYISVDNTNNLQFLGYSEQGMRIQLRETFEDVYADLLGPKVPIDVQRFHADALITGDLIRWNEGLFQLIEDRSRTVTGAAAGWGMVARVETGALMLAQNKTFRLLCDAVNSVIQSQAFPNMRPYNFPTVYLHDMIERRRGARAERVHVMFRALSNWTNIGTTTPLASGNVLYNFDRTGIPGNAPN